MIVFVSACSPESSKCIDKGDAGIISFLDGHTPDFFVSPGLFWDDYPLQNGPMVQTDVRSIPAWARRMRISLSLSLSLCIRNIQKHATLRSMLMRRQYMMHMKRQWGKYHTALAISSHVRNCVSLAPFYNAFGHGLWHRFRQFRHKPPVDPRLRRFTGSGCGAAWGGSSYDGSNMLGPKPGFTHTRTTRPSNIWLVVYTPEKNMKVNWDDEIPNMEKSKSCSKPSTKYDLRITKGWMKTLAIRSDFNLVVRI